MRIVKGTERRHRSPDAVRFVAELVQAGAAAEAAMILGAIRHAQQQGYPGVVELLWEDDRDKLALYDRLGFERQWCSVTLEKKV